MVFIYFLFVRAFKDIYLNIKFKNNNIGDSKWLIWIGLDNRLKSAVLEVVHRKCVFDIIE